MIELDTIYKEQIDFIKEQRQSVININQSLNTILNEQDKKIERYEQNLKKLLYLQCKRM